MKGFFSFIIVLLVIITIFGIITFFDNSSIKKSELINTLIELENNSKERTIIENNLDRIIEKKLLEQLIIENYNLSNAKENVNKAIINYLKNGEVKTIYFNNKEKLTLGRLNSMTSVSIIEINGIKVATFEFTSSFNKNEIVTKQINERFDFYFSLPIAYKNKVVIISA